MELSNILRNPIFWKSTASGKFTITATVVDKDGNPILKDGNEITASQIVKFKAGIFQKIGFFFKKREDRVRQGTVLR